MLQKFFTNFSPVSFAGQSSSCLSPPCALLSPLSLQRKVQSPERSLFFACRSYCTYVSFFSLLREEEKLFPTIASRFSSAGRTTPVPRARTNCGRALGPTSSTYRNTSAAKENQRSGTSSHPDVRGAPGALLKKIAGFHSSVRPHSLLVVQTLSRLESKPVCYTGKKAKVFLACLCRGSLRLLRMTSVAAVQERRPRGSKDSLG